MVLVDDLCLTAVLNMLPVEHICLVIIFNGHDTLRRDEFLE